MCDADLASTVAPPLQPANASPSTAAALPQTFTGTLTGTLTWLPPPIDSLPEVCQRSPRCPPPTCAPPLQPANASPSSASALPQALTGAFTAALPWLPPRIDSFPEVCQPPPPPAAPAPPLQPDAASPSAAALLPQTFTGTLTGTLTWLPPRMEWLPEVCQLWPPWWW